MSVAGGWFFLMVSESFQLGDKDFRLPGLGSYMSVAASAGNIPAMIWAALAMILLIVFLDQVLWRPLVAWSQKFRIETISSNESIDSWFLHTLRSASLITHVKRYSGKMGKFILSILPKPKPEPKKGTSSIFLIILLSVLTGVVLYLLYLVKDVPLKDWLFLAKMGSLTFSRVVICLLISLAWTLPVGLCIGLSKNLSRFLQPLLQVMASFPSTLLFPILIWDLTFTHIPLEIGSIVLMLMGTGWYILFNILAGVSTISTDLREMSASLQLSTRQRFTALYLPGIFPYLTTGLLAAAGGAWNVSIVAEYLSYNGHILTTPGLGSSISLAAAEGNIPLLIASITVMVAIVITLNYLVWLRLYHYSEKRFSLNT